jgi:hypothetical protein
MAQVLEFEPAVVPRKETPQHRRIRLASHGLSALFGVIFLLDIALVVVAGLPFLVDIPGVHVSIGRPGMMLTFGPGPIPAGYVVVGSLPLAQRLAHLAMGLVVAPPGLLILWNLRQLFRLYGRGVVFSEANARRIKWIGLCLAANAIAPLISVSVLSALHMVVDHTWFHADTIPELVLGGVVYVIAQVMEVGRQIEEEQDQFV